MLTPKPPTKIEIRFLKQKLEKDPDLNSEELTDRELWIIEGWLND